MLKNYFSILFVLIGFLAFASCSESNEPVDNGNGGGKPEPKPETAISLVIVDEADHTKDVMTLNAGDTCDVKLNTIISEGAAYLYIKNNTDEDGKVYVSECTYEGIFGVGVCYVINGMGGCYTDVVGVTKENPFEIPAHGAFRDGAEKGSNFHFSFMGQEEGKAKIVFMFEGKNEEYPFYFNIKK